jgi:hypothetical protein
VVLVNWYLVPPYGTFEVASAENVVSLVVFPLVAGASAILMERSGAGRAALATERAAGAGRRHPGLGRVRGRWTSTGSRCCTRRVVATSGGIDRGCGAVVDVACPAATASSPARAHGRDPSFLSPPPLALVRRPVVDEERRAELAPSIGPLGAAS